MNIDQRPAPNKWARLTLIIKTNDYSINVNYHYNLGYIS